MREIPLKNYIIASIIVILTVFLTLYLKRMYEVNVKYLEVSDNEISFSNLENYLYENSDVIVYLKENQESKPQNSFINVVYDNALNKQVIYIDLSSLSNEDRLNFYNMYCNNLISIDELFSTPNIILFSDEKIVDIFSRSNLSFNNKNIISFLTKNGWLND